MSKATKIYFRGRIRSSIREVVDTFAPAGVTPRAVYERLRQGQEIEQAVMTPSRRSRAWKETDARTGEVYTTRDVIASTGMPAHRVYSRIARGYSGDLLRYTGNLCASVCRDHLGREYPALRQMAHAWHISPALLRYRLERGWSVEKSLTTPPDDRTPRSCRDHTGKEYPTLTAMAQAWGLTLETLRSRMRKGWSLEEQLTIPAGEGYHRIDGAVCQDHLGRVFPTWKDLWRYHRKRGRTQIKYDTFAGRIRIGWDVKKALFAKVRGGDK